MPRILGDLQPAPTAENQRLVPGKCAAFLPATDSGLEPLSQRGAELCQPATRPFGGLEALGSPLQGRCVTKVRGDHAAVLAEGPAGARAEDARALRAALLDMARCCPDPRARRAACTLLAKSAARRLGYDMRLCPPRAPLSASQRASGAVQMVMGARAGQQLGHDCAAVASVHTFLGGFGMRPMDLVRAQAAFWKSRVSCKAAVLTVSAGLGRPLATRPDAPAAGRARGDLESAGICVRLGRVAITDEARLEYEAGPRAADFPAGAAFHFYASVSLLAASQGPEAEGRARGGRWRAGLGRLLERFHAGGEAVLSDSAFDVTFRHRLLDLLGAPTTRASEPSRRAASGEEGQQGARGRPLNVAGYRALRCPVGPHRSRLRNEVAQALAEWISSRGGHVDIERCVPELRRRRDGGVIEEARLDLVVSWPGAPARERVDFAVRSAAEPVGAAAQQFIAASAAAARRVATLPSEPGGQQGADYARQIASRVSLALVARLADLLPAAVPGATATGGGRGRSKIPEALRGPPAMQALNGRQVQGKCVMIRFARSAPGVRPPGPLPRHGAPELIPQTAGMAKLISQKFKPADGNSESPRLGLLMESFLAALGEPPLSAHEYPRPSRFPATLAKSMILGRLAHKELAQVVAAKRFDDAAKERERCQAELQRALSSRAKLEGSCRELQQQKSSISRENQRIAEEEQSRHSELKEKFQQAIKDVQEKMDAELEVRQHFLRENEDLRGKLLKFTETYEAQERHVAEQREARTREMEAPATRASCQTVVGQGGQSSRGSSPGLGAAPRSVVAVARRLFRLSPRGIGGDGRRHAGYGS
ncbi:unnamed protein product [Prorocentrum cordatum]|uniref:Uncharacterized protein n=1 Tax=Prorocentrum cordatum TaxID=2364126 RepID=A0ABN9T722_9DINO|nr:unnamed protein product [Polarella glacialis]